MKKTPSVLLIMDGFGLAEAGKANAISQARTPELDKLFAENPHTQLEASGESVGLPAGQIGNSEVGHTNIGAGRVVYQSLPRITHAVEDGSFFENPVYLDAIRQAKAGNKALHVLGLLSDGGVHAHTGHIFAMLELAKREGLSKVYIHAFLDGRDVPPASGKAYVAALCEKCTALGVGKLATLQGRFYGMDRDKRWDRLQKGYDAMVYGIGKPASDPVQAVQDSYDAGITDEFIEPAVLDADGKISCGDSVIFMNFRPDRAREITWALTGNLPEGAQMHTEKLDLHFVCTAQYDEALTLPVAFPPEVVPAPFGQYLSTLGLRQLRIAETEKYAHVTFFFNGGREEPFPGEDRVLIPSPKEYATYDLIPRMSAFAVTEEAIRRIESGEYDVVIINLANCDMVGHTGKFAAAVEAVETVDTCVGRIVSAVRRMGGITLVTADHGNADCMIAEDGEPHTAHTTNPVPLIVAGADVTLHPGRLADIVPTMLTLMGLHIPEEMTGNSLIDMRK